jgi:hypothetical protein
MQVGPRAMYDKAFDGAVRTRLSPFRVYRVRWHTLLPRSSLTLVWCDTLVGGHTTLFLAW